MKTIAKLTVVGALVIATTAFTVVRTTVGQSESEFGPAEAKMALKYGPEWRTRLLSAMDTNRAEFNRLKGEWYGYMVKYPDRYTP